MTYHWIVPLVAAILNAAVGLIVLRHDPKTPLNRCFGLVSATVVSWNLNILFLYALENEQQALFWSGVFRVGTLMAGSVALHMMILLNGTQSRLIWSLLGISYAIALLLVGANASGRLIHDLREYPWGFYPVGT